MAKTFNDYIRDAQADMASEGYDTDYDTCMAIAEAMLFDSKFKALAKEYFPSAPKVFTLQECVANCLA